MLKKINVSDYITNFFVEKKIKYIFLVPGGGNMYLVNSIKKSKKLKYISCFHEQSATIASEYYSRISENIGACCVTSGPGSTNAITGVAGAWLDSIPLIIISGQVKTADISKKIDKIRQTGPQEVNITSLVKNITKYCKTIKKAENIPYELDKAYKIAISGRQGPVWLDIPLDIQSSLIYKKYNSEKINKFKKKSPNVNVNKVKKLLTDAKRPLIYIGHGVRLSQATKIFIKLIKKLQIPFVTTWNTIDIVPFDYKLNQGSPGNLARRFSNFAIQNCDLLICIGVRINKLNTGFNIKNFSKLSKKIIIDVDKNELKKIKIKKTYKIECDAKDFIKALIKIKIKNNLYTHWIKHLIEVKNRYKNEILYKKEGNKLNHYETVQQLSSLLPANYVICTGSSGLAIEIFYSHFQNKHNQRISVTAGLGSMGYGLPAAIGAAAANKVKNNICCIESDGSLMFNVQELATIASYKLPIKIILLNNGGYASIRSTQENFFKGNYVGTGPEDEIQYPNYKKLCSSFNIKYNKIAKISDFSKIKKNLFNNSPVFFDIVLRNNELLIPKIKTIIDKNNNFISMPLEDLSPLLKIKDLKKEIFFPVKYISKFARSLN